MMAAPPPAGTFHDFMERARRADRLVVQPRMGFSSVERMRAGLIATRQAADWTAGTVTLDSYTRVGDLAATRRALREGHPLNGYPIVTLGPDTTREMLRGIRDATFPVQVRHGSAAPGAIFTALMACGLDATEGGPVSYCLPYGRVPLNVSVRAWREATRQLADLAATGVTPHLESFGGCMLGQLCPPSLLVAISVLECMFFAQQGIASVSLSYAQQTHPDQDAEAVAALRSIASDLLPQVAWHVVIYAYMGLYPATPAGAGDLLADAARLARRTGAARLIVKTAAEATQIPTIGDNVTALRVAAQAAATVSADTVPANTGPAKGTGIEAEARAIIEQVLSLNSDLGRALTAAFAMGYLDVPYCLHPDNAQRARSYIDADGYIRWGETGALPVSAGTRSRGHGLTSGELLHALSYVRDRYDTSDPALATHR